MKLFSDYFIGPSNGDSSRIVIPKEVVTFRVVLPVRLLILLLLPLSLRTYHVYVEENVRNVIHLILDPFVFIIGTIMIYPSVRIFFDRSTDGYLFNLLNALKSIYQDNVDSIFENLKSPTNVKKSNRTVLLISALLLGIWVVGLKIFNIDLTIVLILMMIGYMSFWVPVLSAVLYVHSLVLTIKSIFDEENIQNLQFNWLVKMIETQNDEDGTLVDFIRFKRQLGLIFGPVIQALLRVMFVIITASIVLVALYLMSSKFGSIPPEEFLGAGYAAVLILFSSLLLFLWFIIDIVKLSFHIKEGLLIRLKELKLELIFDRDDGDKYLKHVRILEELEDLLSNTPILLIPYRTFVDIVTTILTVVGVILALFQYLS